MKKLREKKALTMVEVVVSIAIFAAIALPLLSVFGQSVKTDKAARDVLNANYICQDYLEKLEATTYLDALTNLPSATPKNGYYLTATITPYGPNETDTDDDCDYAHIVMYDDGKMLSVMPDGRWRLFHSAHYSMSFGLSGHNYSFTCESTNFSGTSRHGKCSFMVNAMKKPSDTRASFSFGGSNCRGRMYCHKGHCSDFDVSGGTRQDFEDIISGDTSLVHVTVSVYALPTDTNAVTTIESYMKLKNW